MEQASRLLERIDVQPLEVQQVLQTRRFRDAFGERGASTEDLLTSKDFKARFQATVEGTSHRATEVRRVEQKFNAYQAHMHDSFEAFKRAPVELRPTANRVRIVG